MTIYEVIKRPIVTEKGVAKKDNERTLCFEVAVGANKTLVKAAVERLFKVKVADVRVAHVDDARPVAHLCARPELPETRAGPGQFVDQGAQARIIRVAAGRFAHRTGASLSVTAGHHDRAVRGRRAE